MYIVHQVIQCLLYGNLMVKEIRMMYAEVKVTQRSFVNP